MPRVRFDRGAFGLAADAIDVPKEKFFNDNNYNEYGQREWCRSVMGRQNFANAFYGEANRGCEHAKRNGDGSDWFGFAVTVRMRYIRRSRRHGQSAANHDRSAYVQCRLDSISDQDVSVADNAGDDFD